MFDKVRIKAILDRIEDAILLIQSKADLVNLMTIRQMRTDL